MAVRELLLLALLWLVQVAMVTGSAGDRAWVFQKCVRVCERDTCTGVSDAQYALEQPFYLRWLWWSCSDDCIYNCMWRTVEAFRMDHSHIPQFFGKWPFVRLAGIQEPASMLFSLLNGLAHLVMLVVFRRKVTSSAPMYYIWHLYAVIAMNAWLWAVIFHTRDFLFTEMMDYVSAVSLVMFSLFALCARIFVDDPVKAVGCGAAILSFFTYHTYYLTFVKFDYGYNMKVNIGVGLVNSVGWVVWSYMMFSRQRYTWKAAVSVILVCSLVLLELGDFPPYLWVFDAHSLWHAGTAPVPLLWYSFLIDDCRYLLKKHSSVSNGKQS